MFRRMFSRSWWWTTLLVLGGIALTIRLGIWQLARYQENHAYNDHLTAMQAASPISLNDETVSADLTGMEYRAIQASGTYDFTHQVAIRDQVWTQTWGDDAGFALLTPLLLSNGKAVLVERGWIPLSDNSPSSWHQFDESGAVRITGVIRLPAVPEMGGLSDPTPAPGSSGSDFWNLVNITLLQKQMPYPLLPFYIQQTPDSAPAGLPYRYSSQPELADDGSNMGYALVWFSFAALLFFGYPVYLGKQAEH